MEKFNILMVGAGRMAEAIISGLSKKPEIGRITVTNFSDKARLLKLADTYGATTSEDWTAELPNNQVVILATPPNSQEEQLKTLAKKWDSQLIMTVAAGIDPSYMEKRLKKGTPVCWVMPNTAAQVGQSMSTFVCGTYVEDRHREMIEIILDSIGESEELTEQQVHDMTAITGSAPAFVYSFADALITAAKEYGLPEDQARKLVVEMMKGSTAMLETEKEPSELIGQVASPGGSTAEGLKVLDEARFQETLRGAIEATNAHARGNQG